MPRLRRRSSLLGAAVVLVLGVGLSAAQQPPPSGSGSSSSPVQQGSSVQPARPAPDTVVARVGDRVITLKEVEDKLRLLPDSMRARVMSGNNLHVYVKGMVTKELFAREAEKRQLDQDPKVRAQLQEGRQDILYIALSQRLLGDLSVTEAEMQAYYDGHKALFDGKSYQEVRPHVAQKLREMKGREAVAAMERDAMTRWPVTMNEAALKGISIPQGYATQEIEKAIEEAERRAGPLPEETKRMLREGTPPVAPVIRPKSPQ